MSTFQKHLAAVKSGKVEKSNIVGIRKAINAYERKARGYSRGTTSPDWTEQDIFRIYSAIEKHKPRVVGVLHDSGLSVLRSPRYAKRLADYSDKLKAISHFRLVEFDYLDPNGLHCVPVYAACNASGATLFVFRNVPWQTAWVLGLPSGPEIKGRDF